MNLRRKIKTKYNKKGLTCLTVDDYLELLEDVEVEDTNEDGVSTYRTRCPLHHNHEHGDRKPNGNPSFMIGEGVTQAVVYLCQSHHGKGKGPCNNKNLTNWFVRQFKKNKKIYSDGYDLSYRTQRKVGGAR